MRIELIDCLAQGCPDQQQPGVGAGLWQQGAQAGPLRPQRVLQKVGLLTISKKPC